MIPQPRDKWADWAVQLIRFLQPWMTRIEATKFTQGQVLRLRPVTVADLPLEKQAAGDVVYVTNESGGAQPASYDGTNWRRFSDRAIVS